MATQAEVGPWVRRFFQNRNRTRLTAAALETLAIVAYRQPITAPEIQAIRGKDSSAALKSLLEKKMTRILGKKKVVGNPLLYGTRKQFLLHFGFGVLGADRLSAECLATNDGSTRILETCGFKLEGRQRHLPDHNRPLTSLV